MACFANRVRWVVFGVLLAAGSLGHAETIEVRVEGMKFVPDTIHAKVGDIVAFRSMPTHFVESVSDMWPAGAAPMRSSMGTDYDYRVTRAGLYVFKCPPHWAGRMGGALIVGNAEKVAATIGTYLQAADRHPEDKPAKGLLYRLLAQMTHAGPGKPPG